MDTNTINIKMHDKPINWVDAFRPDRGNLWVFEQYGVKVPSGFTTSIIRMSLGIGWYFFVAGVLIGILVQRTL